MTVTKTYYTATTSVNREITWRCSHCGELNRAPLDHEVGVSMSSGGSYSRNTAKLAANITDASKWAYLDQLHMELGGRPVDFKNYIKYKFSDKSYACQKCSAKEPWAGWNIRGLTTFGELIGAGFAIVALVQILFSANKLKGLLNLLIGAALIFASAFAEKKYEKRQTERVAALPRTSLPILVEFGQPLINMDAPGPQSTTGNEQTLK